MHATSGNMYSASSKEQPFALPGMKNKAGNQQHMGSHTFPCECMVPYMWYLAGTSETAVAHWRHSALRSQGVMCTLLGSRERSADVWGVRHRCGLVGPKIIKDDRARHLAHPRPFLLFGRQPTVVQCLHVGAPSVNLVHVATEVQPVRPALGFEAAAYQKACNKAHPREVVRVGQARSCGNVEDVLDVDLVLLLNHELTGQERTRENTKAQRQAKVGEENSAEAGTCRQVADISQLPLEAATVIKASDDTRAKQQHLCRQNQLLSPTCATW
jgi:hypothetical protein